MTGAAEDLAMPGLRPRDAPVGGEVARRHHGTTVQTSSASRMRSLLSTTSPRFIDAPDCRPIQPSRDSGAPLAGQRISAQD